MSTHPLNKKIGENIEQFRLQSKKNIKQMASLLGLTESGYRNIERGITEAGIVKLFKIAEILNISVLQLMIINNEDDHHKIINYPLTSKADDAVYRLCIEQYKAENHFLKKQIGIMEELLGKTIGI